MAHCYTFQSCNEDLYPSISNLCSDDVSVHAGKLLYYNSDPSKWYKLIYNGEDTCVCSGLLGSQNITITELTDCTEVERELYIVRNCNTNEEFLYSFEVGALEPIEPCETCPELYVLAEDGETCVKTTDVAATFNGAILPFNRAATNSSYGFGGANFYQTLDGRGLPVEEYNSPDVMKDSATNILSVVQNIQGIWDNTIGINGRMNDIGVWNNSIPDNSWEGFSVCVDIPETKKYSFGVGGKNRVKVKYNGNVIVDMNKADPSSFSYNFWHIFEMTFDAGIQVFEVEIYNDVGLGSVAFEIYNADQQEMTGWTLGDEITASIIYSTQDLSGASFNAGTTVGYSCPVGYAVNFCESGGDGGGDPFCRLIETEILEPCVYEVIKLEQYPCECFTVIEKIDETGNYEHVTVLGDSYESCEECVVDGGGCSVSERTIAYAGKVVLPKETPPDRGFKDCCYDNLVLANGSGKDWENDFNGFYFRKQMGGDTCDFILKDMVTASTYALNSATYGDFWDFGDYPDQQDLTVYIVRWDKVLALLGTGMYQIQKDVVVAGVPFTLYSNTFHLEQFSNDLADKTVRIDAVMNGELVHYGVNFKGTGFTTSLRTKGYFGNRNPTYKQDNLVKRNYDTVQISMSQENEYQYQTSLLPICITEELYDFILFGNELYVSDYNLANHSYGFTKFGVELSSNKGAKYYVNNRDARANLVFIDRKKDKRKINC